jgi:hypothetical protein
MKFKAIIPTLILALVAFTTVAIADSTTPNTIVTGKVISSTPTQLVVEDGAGARTTFVVDAGAVPSTIMVGDKVSVTYQSQAGGSFRATNVSAVALSDLESSKVAVNDPSTLPPANPSYESTTTTTTSTSTTVADSSLDNDLTADTLPATASNLPLVLLLGVLALGGFILRTVTRS